MAAPSVYGAITAITAEFAESGIARTHRNQIDQYLYRSIDDLTNRLSPLLAKHRLCILPRVTKRTVTECKGPDDELLVNVCLCVSYELVSAEDGSSHVVRAFGEALDAGDKATAKAMSSAYKSAMLQTFCVPVSGVEEPNAHSPRVTARTHAPAPLQGWAAWVVDIKEIVRSCESIEAVDGLQQRQRTTLQSLSRERPEMYAELGLVFAQRAAELKSPPGQSPAPTGRPASRPTSRKQHQKKEPVLA